MHVNAATDPWILVADEHGRTREVSLLSALADAGHWAGLAGEPPVVAATLRLLIAVVLDATGAPRDEAEWACWWREGLPAQPLVHYLEQHRARMDLHSPDRPFLQDARVPERVGMKSVAELAPHLATGQNPVIYCDTTDLGGPNPARFTQAEALRWLVSFHQFTRTGMWANAAGSGPAVGRAGVLLDRLLVVPTGPTLAHTLMLNLPSGKTSGCPPWRSDDPVHGRPPQNLVELLTWQTRHVKLLPDADGAVTRLLVAVDPAVDPAVPRTVIAALDPHITAVPAPKAMEGWSLLTYEPDVATWRAAAVLGTTVGGSRTVRALTRRAEVVGSVPVSVEAIGLAVESKAKYVSWVRESLPLTVRGVAPMHDAVRIAEAFSEACVSALVTTRQAAGLLPSRPPREQRTLVSRAAQHAYWPQLESLGRDLTEKLEHAADDPRARSRLMDGWLTQVASAAHLALDTCTSTFPATTRFASARAKGHRVISRAAFQLAGEAA